MKEVGNSVFFPFRSVPSSPSSYKKKYFLVKKTKEANNGDMKALKRRRKIQGRVKDEMKKSFSQLKIIKGNDMDGIWKEKEEY